ncbi:MAG: glycosyltransferase family 2 protein [Betaproteobacteria bacterium]|nr:glycosyltransferase family 2 protein [Betaproteobacteria bacterium]MDE2621818.1 glycosyltransferase family 2 protein [Betaproteobacteria bacterium]
MAPTLSLVIPMHNEAPNVASCYERIRTILDPLGESWELLCVNDGSRDDTLTRLLALHKRDPRVIVIDLSRNFGKEAALTAGLDQAQGEAVIPMDADLQDPPELIPDLLARWREGFDVVLAVRSSRSSDSLFKRGTARFFYRFINRMSEVPIPEDAGDFRLMSRNVVEALKLLPERRRFMKGLFAWVGFKTAEVHYERPPRMAGETKFNAWRLWNFALEGITSFSHLPLKVASYFGLAVSFFAFLYAIKIVIDTLVYGNPVKGYPSLMVAILFFSGVQLVAIGVIGEYLGRLYEESKQRPVYLIRKRYGPPVEIP